MSGLRETVRIVSEIKGPGYLSVRIAILLIIIAFGLAHLFGIV